MMRFQAGRAAVLLAPLFLVAACAGAPTATQDLNGRLTARLAPEIQAGQVAVHPLADGSQVAIPEDSLFPPGSARLDDKGRSVLTYFIQALLEPTILTIQVADASNSLEGARAQAIIDFLRQNSLWSRVQAGSAPTSVQVGAVGTPIQGVTITVNVLPS